MVSELVRVGLIANCQGHTMMAEGEGRPRAAGRCDASHGKGTADALNKAERADGWALKLVTQSAQSSDLNINELGFSHFWRVGYGEGDTARSLTS